MWQMGGLLLFIIFEFAVLLKHISIMQEMIFFFSFIAVENTYIAGLIHWLFPLRNCSSLSLFGVCLNSADLSFGSSPVQGTEQDKKHGNGFRYVQYYQLPYNLSRYEKYSVLLYSYVYLLLYCAVVECNKT